MKTMKTRPRLRTLLALSAVALLAFAGFATAKDRSSSNHASSTGTITAFDSATDELTIKTTAGDSFTAVVDRRTKIRCEDQSGHGRHRGASSSRRDSGSSDDNGGRGELEPGDDHGGNGNEPGDDNGGLRGHDDNGVGADCTSADLTVGASVHKAELELEHGQASWDEIELARS